MKIHPIVYVCGILLSIAAADARGAVTIEVLNAAAGKYIVTYDVNVTKAESTEYVFPNHGLISDDKKIDVVSVRETNANQKLEHEILPGIDSEKKPVPGRYRVKAKFINPLPEKSVYTLEYKVILYNKNDCYVDEDGRWVFRYSTGHDAFFVLPKNHVVVFADFPVVIFEQQGRTVLVQKLPERRTFVIKTMPVSG